MIFCARSVTSGEDATGVSAAQANALLDSGQAVGNLVLVAPALLAANTTVEGR
jgi:hypothetical protein